MSDYSRQPPATAEAGYTLMEILVVLAILAMIAAFAGPRVIGYLGSARGDAARVQINNLEAALDLYRLEVGRYPNAQQGLQALLTAPPDTPGWRGPYLDKAEGLIDPWGRPYGYRIPESGADYQIFSLGADGQEGGEDENADIVSG